MEETWRSAAWDLKSSGRFPLNWVPESRGCLVAGVFLQDFPIFRQRQETSRSKAAEEVGAHVEEQVS